MTSRRFAFGHFIYDCDLGVLFSQGAPVELGGKARALLQALLETDGKGVSKSDLLERAWPGLSVEESNLTVQISALRKCLAKSSDETWIETIPRLGYRLLPRRIVETDAVPAERRREKASIAVLPFTNMGGDPEQDIFTDGLSEDLITDLSRNTGLFVIARHSTFAYKGRLADVRSIASDLGVRYLLQGSARRTAERVRINVQLIDATGGDNLWAERFDRNLEDIFAVQDEVTARIVEELVGRLSTVPARKRATNMLAYELCVRARTIVTSYGGLPKASREATSMLWQACALDPGYAESFRWLALALWQEWTHGFDTMEPARQLSLKMAHRAAELDRNDAGNHWVLGFLLAFERRWEDSEISFASAFEIDPNDADALILYSEMAALGGHPEIAIERLKRSLLLNPHPAPIYFWELGLTYYAAGQYEAAAEVLRTDATYSTGSRRILAASLAQLGKLEEARREGSLFMADNPNFRIGFWANSQPARDEATVKRFVDGYRKAGLPD